MTSSRVHSDVLSNEGGVDLKASDTDLTVDNSASKVTWIDCNDLNDHGRMEIYHIFATGAMVGRTIMHSWGHTAPLRTQTDGGPHHCMLAHPTLVPSATNMVNFYNIRQTKSQDLNVSRLILQRSLPNPLKPSREWRCSWSSTDRLCSNYIWVINNFIAYYGATYISGFMIHQKPNKIYRYV